MDALQDIGVAKTPHWLTRAFSLVERDDLTVNLNQLTTLQKVAFGQHRCAVIYSSISL